MVSFMSSIVSILKLLLLVYLGLGTYLYIKQRSFVYFPTAESQDNHGQVLNLLSNDEQLKIWVLNPNKANAIFYFGGNAESVEYNIQPFQTWFPNHTLYLMNYRGYGGSTGSPTEAALYADALALYDKVSTLHKSISIIGRSLGSGVATYLGANREVKQFALVTPYDSVANVAQAAYPMYPMSLLFKDKYDSISRAQQIHAKVLLIIAENDEMIPRKHSNNLADALLEANVEVEIELLMGATHNSFSEDRHYKESLQNFMGEFTSRSTPQALPFKEN